MNFSSNALTEWFEKISLSVMAYRKEVLIGLGITAGLISGVMGYMWYKHHAQIAAHKDLIDFMQVYDASITAEGKAKAGANFASEQEKWRSVQELAASDYNRHKHAGIASWYLVYEAEALANLGKHAQAAEVLKRAIDKMPSETVKDFYRVKLALINIDSDVKDTQKQGFQALEAIAQDSKHAANEVALYYLGAYFWAEKEYTQAKNYWQQLMVKYGYKDAKQQSGYADLVKEKLRLISADW